VSPPLLALDRVSKAFGSLIVVDGLSLAVEDGEALGVIGPNGAGKTTALNLMIGRLRPDRGAVVFAGRDVTRLGPHARCRAGIALTHQIPHPFEALTVFENVLVGATFGRGARFGRAAGDRSAPDACAAALELSGLAPKANTRAGALTLLERKRLELARALATRPRVLLLDEIAGGLSEGEVHDVARLVRSINAEGVAIIWIEHIVHALRAAVSRLVAINVGRTLVEGPPDAVMANPEVQRVYLGIDVQ
jgi:branched-chain amino acid transport system ATP-binding protein